MREIDHDTYLKAKGLFHLAHEHYGKAQEFEEALGKLLGFDDSYLGFLSDAVGGEHTFEEALEKEKITVTSDG